MFWIAFIKNKFLNFSGLIILLLGGMLFLGLLITPQDLPKQPMCFSLLLFKQECPGCGLTRGFLSMARGHWHNAWNFNPTAVFLYLFFLSVWLTEWWRILKNKTREIPFYYRKITPWLAGAILIFAFIRWGVVFLLPLLALRRS